MELQRAIAGGDNLVSEGRDQGTVVFPDAECKIFLTASEDERARRRSAICRPGASRPPWRNPGRPATPRPGGRRPGRSGRLLPAADAIRVSTDGLSLDEVVDRLESLARRGILGSLRVEDRGRVRPSEMRRPSEAARMIVRLASSPALSNQT